MQVEGTKNSRPLQKSWRDFLRKTALSLACLLLASAGICWVAANWQDASRMQKLAGAQALLAVLILLAAWACLWWRKSGDRNFSLAANLAGLAAVVMGTLLALVGQIYQTGADAWQLFLLWAVLLAPWLLAMRTVFLALLFAVLLNVALALYLYGVGNPGVLGWLDSFFDSYSPLVLAGLNLLLLLAWELSVRHLSDQWRIGPRILAAAVIGWWIQATLVNGFDDSGALMSALPGLALMAVLYAVYRRVRQDLAIVSLALVGAFMLVAVPLVFRIDGEGSLFLVIVVLLVLALVGIRYLAALARDAYKTAGRGALPVSEGATPDAPEPWFIAMFRMVVMSVIAVLVMALLMLLLDLSLAKFWLVSLGLSAVGMLVYRIQKSAIIHEMAVIITTSGVIMFCVSIFDTDLSLMVAVLALLVLGAAVYLAVPNVVLRFLSAFMILGSLAVITWPGEPWSMLFDAVTGQHGGYLFHAYLRVWLATVLAILALVAADGRGQAQQWAPLAWALVVLAQLAAWLAPAPTLLGGVPLWSPLSFIWLACAVLPVLALLALLWRNPGLPLLLRLGAPLALAVASIGWAGAPGISLALLWLIFGYGLRRRGLLVFGALALLAYLGRFYYALDSTLLHKSWVLGLTGGWLLLSGLLLWRRLASDGTAPGATRAAGGLAAPAGLLAGLVIVLVVVNTGIHQREGILTHGQRVVLQLAPVDPRSLMQGDYMALDFDVARKVIQQSSSAQGHRDVRTLRRHGYLRLRPRSDGVYELAGVLDHWPGQNASAAGHDSGGSASPADSARDTAVANGSAGAGGDEVLLEFRQQGNRVRIVTNAWFFPEGKGSHYTQARYGEFRVGQDGVGLLTGMLDEHMQAL